MSNDRQIPPEPNAPLDPRLEPLVRPKVILGFVPEAPAEGNRKSKLDRHPRCEVGEVDVLWHTKHPDVVRRGYKYLDNDLSLLGSPFRGRVARIRDTCVGFGFGRGPGFGLGFAKEEVQGGTSVGNSVNDAAERYRVVHRRSLVAAFEVFRGDFFHAQFQASAVRFFDHR